MCIQTESGEELAVKVSKKCEDDDRAEREFSILQSLQHPHLVQVYELYTSPNSYAMILEL